MIEEPIEEKRNPQPKKEIRKANDTSRRTEVICNTDEKLSS